MLLANFTTLSFIEPELLAIEVSIVEIGNFAIFCSRDLCLDLMTFMYVLSRIP